MRIKITSNCCSPHSPLYVQQKPPYLGEFAHSKVLPEKEGERESWNGSVGLFFFISVGKGWMEEGNIALQTGKMWRITQNCFWNETKTFFMSCFMQSFGAFSFRLKFLHIREQNYFMCENSRRDEKSLNDDWRKLQKTERKRGKIVFLGSCECKNGVKIANHTHLYTRPYKHREKISSSRSLMREWLLILHKNVVLSSHA